MSCPVFRDRLPTGEYVIRCRECNWASKPLAECSEKVTRNCGGRGSQESSDCPHLGPPLEEDDGSPAVEMVPCSCGGNANKETPATIFFCALYEECLPAYHGTGRRGEEYRARADAIRLCHGCKRGAE